MEGDVKDDVSSGSVSIGNVKIITNVKPWVLDQHPRRAQMPTTVFVQAASGNDNNGSYRTFQGPEKSLLWSKGLGDHDFGSYIDFSSRDAVAWWKEQLTEQLLKNHLTGIWYVLPLSDMLPGVLSRKPQRIDNNEFSGLLDDNATYRGDISFWGHPGHDEAGEVGVRMGWGASSPSVGEAGRVSQAMGMAKVHPLS